MKLLSRKNGIRRFIMVATTIFTIVIGILVVAAGNYIYSRYMENTTIDSAQTGVNVLADYIDNSIDDVEQVISYCNASNSINLFISTQTNTNVKKRDAYEALSAFCGSSSSHKYLHRVVVTNMYGSYIQIVTPAYSSTINVAKTLSEQVFYDDSTGVGYSDFNFGFLSDPFYPRKELNIIPILRPLTYKYNNNLGGYIFIEVDDDLFLDAFESSSNDALGLLTLTLGDKTYLYEDKSFKLLDKPLSEDEYIIISRDLQKKNCSVAMAITMSQAKHTSAIFTMMLAFILVLLAILAVFLNAVLDYAINGPVDKIRKRLEVISTGDFSRDSSIEWDHELGEIGQGVNDLAESVGDLIETKLKDAREKKDLEYKMLQSQINPHFIYNTLNSIKWMATVQGATGISEMTTSLARLLKSISKGTTLLISIKEELELLDDYFTIQNYRYGGTIELIKNIEDEELLNHQIVKFTMQPLVENAIFHGIEPTGRNGIITINIHSIEDTICIDISDNGVGMTEEKCQTILTDASESTSDFFKEIGVSNVHKRLQYQFGTGYGITVDSKLNEGTTMSINIPKVEI